MHMNGEAVLYQLETQSPFQVMSYIMQNADGDLVVIDGGGRAEADYLLQNLKKLSGNKPHIKAWFLTHAHYDHTGAFQQIMEIHADEIVVDRIYYHFPEMSYVEQYEPKEFHTIAEFQCIKSRFDNITTIVQQGERITIGNLSFLVMHVPNQAVTNNVLNNSSIVLRCDIGEQRVLFLSDAGIEAGRELLESWSHEDLHADFVQMAHHGQHGVEKQVYEAVAPQGCLWTAPRWLWDNDAGNGYNTGPFQTVIVRGWMEELKVKHHYVDKDGLQVIQFPYRFEPDHH